MQMIVNMHVYQAALKAVTEQRKQYFIFSRFGMETFLFHVNIFEMCA